MFTAVIGVMEGLGIILGPLVGGALTAHATWRWCFWINLPVGAVTSLVIAFLLHPPKVQDGPSRTLKEKLCHFDWLGTAIIIPSLVCLLLALQWGGSRYRWNDARVISLFVVFAVLLLVFIIKEKVSTSIFTIPRLVASSRSMIFSTLFAFCLSAAISILSFYLPLWFQAIKGASAFDSGVMLLPVILGLLAGTLIAGVLVTILGYYQPFMVLSGIFAAIGAGLLTSFNADTPTSVWIGYLSLVGIGAGLGFQQPFLAVQTVLEKSDIAIGTSLIILSQTMAGAIFVSVGGTIFSNELVGALKVQVPQLNPMIVLESGATNIREYVPQEYLEEVLRAFNSAIVRTFYAAVATSGLAALVALGVEVRCIKTTKPADETKDSRERTQGSAHVHADS
jgi:MFS family permease